MQEYADKIDSILEEMKRDSRYRLAEDKVFVSVVRKIESAWEELECMEIVP